MIEFCGICKYRKQKSIDSDWVCTNPKSEYCTDWIDYDDGCLEWEMMEDQDKWTPVSERLPENDEKVLCQTVTKKGQINMVIGFYDFDRWCCGMNSNVLAWMPLPEPYKESEGE